MTLYDINAERAVVGSLLLDRDAIAAVAPILDPDDMFDERCRLVYAAQLECYRQRTPPDPTLVLSRLQSSGTLERAGGAQAVLALASAAPTAAHADHYARVVADHAVRRQLLMAAAEIARRASDTTAPLADTVTACIRQVVDAGSRRDDAPAARLDAVTDAALTLLRGGTERGVTTGLYDLDRLIGHLLAGDLCVVAGRPGHGKTSLALTVARHLAHRASAVYVISLEMDRHQVLQRLVAMECGVGTDTQRSQQLSADELVRVTSAYGRVSDWPIWIDDRAGLSVDDVRTRVMRHASLHGTPDLVIVDYLQRMRITVGRGQNYAQAVGQVSSALKTLARELGAPILALSQLNRDIDRRSDRTPVLADLRESGDIEADADQVVMLVRPDLYDAGAGAGIIDLYVAKNRHGAVGRATCRYDAPRALVQNLHREH